MTRIGTDESGKGDYFGALVIAGVALDDDIGEELTGAGLKDSKRLAEATIRRLAGEIRRRCEHEVVRISPRRYNELHDRMGNVNLMLAWGHARVIENLLSRRPECELAVADQFGDEHYLERALLARGRRIRLEQRVRAEEDPAVAAASVLAREAFLDSLVRLSRAAGQLLPKGATHVLPAARAVLARGGIELLGEVAKLHFRTTKQAAAGSQAE